MEKVNLYEQAKEQGLKTVSYSQLSLYNNCPWKWKLDYIDRLKIDKPNIYLVFGTSLHETIQKWLEILYDKGVKASNEFQINKFFLESIKTEYTNRKAKYGKDFIETSVFTEFYKDGVAILTELKRKRTKYFKTRGYELLGCEFPILMPTEQNNKVGYIMYLDIVIKDTTNNVIYIYDIKTSTSGWRDKEKKDFVNKSAQLLLYKKYYAKKFNIDLADIIPIYFIVKRKLFENCDFPQSRIQIYKPPHGKIKMNQLLKLENNFINIFDINGKVKENIKFKKAIETSVIKGRSDKCIYCAYKDTNHCKL